DTFIGSIVKDAFLAKNLAPPRMTAVSTSRQLDTALLATDRFLAVRSTSMLQFSGKHSSVKALPIDLPFQPLRVGVVTLKNRTISPVVLLFIECVRKVAKLLGN